MAASRETSVRPFDHERLEVYQTSIEFFRFATALIRGTKPDDRYLADQLHRAAASITLNIAEGAGEYSRKDKARFYRMALRSTTECAAVLDLLAVSCPRAAIRTEAGRAPLLRMIAMLTRMTLNATARASTVQRRAG